MVSSPHAATQIGSILALCLVSFLTLPAIAQTDPANPLPAPSGSLQESYEDSLPLLGDNSSSILSLADELELGLNWLQALRGSVPITTDPQIQSYLENLLGLLAEKSELRARSLHPIIINDPGLNAFAAPGGIIGVNTGLFLKARSEGELSAVLAHELAHLSQRHYARRVKSSKLTSVAGLVLILSSILAALSGSSDSGLAAIYAGTAALQASQLNYSRRDEREADRIGLRTLLHSGYSPHAAAHMFETLRSVYNLSSDRPPEYLLTHPYTERRLSDARSRAQQLEDEGVTGKLDHPLFHIIKIRAQMEERSSVVQTTLEFEDRLKKANGIDKVFASYGLAMAYSRQSRHLEAIRLLDNLRANQVPDSLQMPLALLRAQILLDAGENVKALELLSELTARNQGLYPLDILHTEALVATLQYQKAEQILRTLRTFRPRDPLVWQLLSDVQLLSGNVLEYHRSNARFHELNGRYHTALQHMEEAVRLASEDEQLHQALIDQRKQLAKLAQEQLR